MAVEKKENPKEAKTVRNKKISSTVKENASTEDFPDELREAFWSVVSFEKCEASSLTYPEAEQRIKELEAQNISGLCIVTDETAARISSKN